MLDAPGVPVSQDLEDGVLVKPGQISPGPGLDFVPAAAEVSQVGEVRRTGQGRGRFPEPPAEPDPLGPDQVDKGVMDRVKASPESGKIAVQVKAGRRVKNLPVCPDVVIVQGPDNTQ